MNICKQCRKITGGGNFIYHILGILHGIYVILFFNKWNLKLFIIKSKKHQFIFKLNYIFDRNIE